MNEHTHTELSESARGERVPVAGQADQEGIYATLDRRLVHRESVNEVFLLSEEERGPGWYQVRAQLPVSHSHYNDTIDYRSDRLALVECTRQAQAVISHRRLGVPFGQVFILDRLRIEWGDALPQRGERLDISVDVETRMLGTRVRSAEFRCAVSAAEDPTRRLADITLWISYTSPEASRSGREAMRGRPVSWSHQADSRSSQVVPLAVGRSWVRNVVIDDVSREREAWTADLVPDFAHPSMFDHPHDHVPGMVILEAAQQLHSVATLGGTAQHRTAMDARFHHYIEIDEPVRIRLEAREGDPSLRYCAVQEDRVCAEITEWVRAGGR